MKKHTLLLDKLLVAMMLLAYVPDLTGALPEPVPALLLPAPEAKSTDENPAERL